MVKFIEVRNFDNQATIAINLNAIAWFKPFPKSDSGALIITLESDNIIHVVESYDEIKTKIMSISRKIFPLVPRTLRPDSTFRKATKGRSCERPGFHVSDEGDE